MISQCSHVKFLSFLLIISIKYLIKLSLSVYSLCSIMELEQKSKTVSESKM